MLIKVKHSSLDSFLKDYNYIRPASPIRIIIEPTAGWRGTATFLAFKREEFDIGEYIHYVELHEVKISLEPEPIGGTVSSILDMLKEEIKKMELTPVPKVLEGSIYTIGKKEEE